MKVLTPYRLAAGLLVLFFAGHTFGGMLAHNSFGPAADAVFASMQNVTFDFNGASGSWYGMWFGFGLTASIFLQFSAVLAWQLDRVPKQSWSSVSAVAWAFVAAHAVNSALIWRYFFAVPGVLSTLATLLLAVGAWRKQIATVG